MVLTPTALVVLACLGLSSARPQLQQTLKFQQPLLQYDQQQQPQLFKPRLQRELSFSDQLKKQVAIIRQNKQHNDDGSFTYDFESEDGIKVQQSSVVKTIPASSRSGVGVRGALDEDGPATVLISEGSFSYVAPDGTPIEVRYTADENGFRAEGAHLPTPPPIPEAIQRALALLPRQDQDGHFDNQ